MIDIRQRLRLLKQTSWAMTASAFLLIVVGILFIYSSSCASENHVGESLCWKQTAWALLGVVCYVVFALTDYRNLRPVAGWAYAAGIALLVLVLLVGKRVYGARRWIMLFPGVGVQPSELAKLAVVILLAAMMSRAGLDLSRARNVMLILLIVAVPVVLIAEEPDLGTALILLPVAAVMMFVAGVPARWLGSLALAGAMAVSLVIAALFLPAKLGAGRETQQKVFRLTRLTEYQRGRIETFFNPYKDPLGAGWNKRQSEIAVGSGGFSGKGYLRGRQNILGFLPRSVAPTDFVYAVIAEEKGFVGSAVVLFLFGSVVAAGMRIALACRDKFGRLLCAGIMAVFFCHAFINIAMTIGLLPIKGLPLPLLSYGGTFMLCTMTGLGIAQSVRIYGRMESSSDIALSGMGFTGR